MPIVSQLFSLLGSQRKELVRILAACGNKSSFTPPNPHDTCNLLDQQTGNLVILNLLTPSSFSSARSRQILSKPNPLDCFVVCASRRTPRIRIHLSYTFKPLCSPCSKDSHHRENTSPGVSSSTTSVHVTALDGIVNVNSLFTVAVFVGLSLTTPNQRSLENRISCDAGIDMAKNLLVFEVVSFSFFLFSSLVAQGLKLAINLLNSKDVDEAFRAHINLKVLRFGMMGSAIGSVMGCVFLMLSMVNVIQIRLGLLSCGSKSAVHAVTALVLLVSSALLVYISTAFYAFLH
ncbi:hypothetical protein NC653_007699 [Populus alba x Populus x berolinensis]|uniref:Maternal effect embryo arrest protein n=1 Tax=Populus alba x Populus x berolinensis TaxID=444605 RepID=A0AAD6RHY3_9ROSI|nr:hypothetical protein NC653_007699 [Populus alba x Populus x berolinensis]